MHPHSSARCVRGQGGEDQGRGEVWGGGTGLSMPQEAPGRTGLASLTLPETGLPQSPNPGIDAPGAPSQLCRNPWTEDVGSQTSSEGWGAVCRGHRQGKVDLGTWGPLPRPGVCSCLTPRSLPSDFKPNRGNGSSQCCSHPPPESPRGRCGSACPSLLPAVTPAAPVPLMAAVGHVHPSAAPRA